MNQFYSCLLLNSGIKFFKHFNIVPQGRLKTFSPPKSEQAKLVANAIEYISMGLERHSGELWEHSRWSKA